MYPRITISGARGIVGEDLTRDNARAMAETYGRLVEGRPVVLARDSRPSGPMIREAVIEGLTEAGSEVWDLGSVPTPTVGLMIRELGAGGGINITASHNPVQWNALKFFGSDGTFPDQAFVDRLVVALPDPVPVNIGEPGRPVRLRRIENARAIHSGLVQRAIPPEPIRARRFRVVVDGCRSVGGIFLPPLLREFGCEVIELDCEPDGAFTRDLEPVPENLSGLGAKVLGREADMGFACDPDADRLAVVSERGRPVGEEFTLALAVEAALGLADRENPIVVTNLSTSNLTDRAAERGGASVIRTPIGEANVASQIAARRALIGGEGNGGVMYPQVHNGRDALTAAALILHLAAGSGRTIEQLVDSYPPYVILKDKVEIDLDQAHRRLAELARENPLGGTIDSRDGVKIILPEGWLHLRCSNTEPIVRIIAEGEGREVARNLVEKGKGLLTGNP